MSNKESIKELKYFKENEYGLSNRTIDLSIEALEKQIPLMADFKHERGDEVALITCPICDRSIIANLERYKEFTKEWYCKKCGQLLTLEDNPKDGKDIPKETIFEYNCIQIDGVTPGGCPVCPTCNEPAYEKDRCVFCGQKFKEG